MTKRTSYTAKLSAPEQQELLRVLQSGNYRPMVVEHAIAAGQGADCTVVLYKSGKAVVQGRGCEEFVSFVLEPLVLKRAGLGYEDVFNPEAIEPHMGVDESGKGDFFGPLVVAAAYVDRDAVHAMREMGVRESKEISSDARALAMARDIRDLLGKRFNVVTIGPAAYNRLYAQMRNVNRMLAWAHARTIENLLQTVPDCPKAISDQFGSKRQVESALMRDGRRIELVQRHRAESDMAVAAASVLARAQFILSLQRLKERFGQTFPKGASDAVRAAAVEFLRKQEPVFLVEVAKCHFRTTEQVLKEAGLERGAIGPLGAATSKPGTFFARRPHAGRPGGGE